MKIKTLIFVSLFLAFSSIYSLRAQEEKQYKVACIAFYNLENLFDTNDDEGVKDTEYTPDGDKQWTNERYAEKQTNMAFVIAKIGTDITPDGPAVLGVSEIENKGVLEDLVKEASIKDRDYKIVHYDSPDRRGVDVGLLYQEKYFKVTNSKSYRLTMPEDTSFITRDQLMVSGLFDGEQMHFIVNHWPSRSGGEKRSQPKRFAAADLTRSIVDSILKTDANAKIIVMGDLNDDPTDPSLVDHLRTVGAEEKMTDDLMFNTMEKLFKSGVGSLAYRDNWNLFDQIVISKGLLGEDRSTYKFHLAKIFNKPFLRQKEGRYKGYPLRTHAGGVYQGGYSDHFPTYIYITKEI